MNKYSKKRKTIAFTGVGVLGLALLTACSSTATPTASCTFVVGDGQNGNDAKIHQVAYPGENVHIGSGEDAEYVACGPRNYIVSDGTLKDANNHKVGDRFTPSIGYTQEGTKVKVYTTAYWTLNESEKVLREFYPFCFKYTCYGTDSEGGTNDKSNFGTSGWNGMLGENFSPAVDDLIRQEMPSFDDTIWKNHDAKQWKQLSDDMSAKFADAIRPMTGVPDDFFCGSGNSGWSNPDTPGKGTFTCSQVRFKVTALDAADKQLQNLQEDESRAAKQKNVNNKELDAAKARYGNDAGYWLGLQDTLKACKDSGGACYVVMGGNGGNSPSVSLPLPAGPQAKK